MSPFPPLLVDGFVYVNALLAVRLMVGGEGLCKVYEKFRPGLLAAGAIVVGLSVCCLVQAYAQIWKDGRSADPLLLSAVARDDELGVMSELRNRAAINDLALAPESLALLLVSVPIHSFASHEHLAIDYPRQAAQSARFFGGKMDPVESRSFLSDYGVRWVVMPDSSPAKSLFKAQVPECRAGRYSIYILPQNRMKPYPGIRAILPPERIQPTLGNLLFGRR
jgi:hypothetical protein